MENILPVILYGLDSNIIKSKELTTTKYNWYFYSYQNFDVEIVEGEGMLYSVIEKIINDNKILETTKDTKFTGYQNFGYTLIFDNPDTTINIKITSQTGFVDVYTINCKLENSITEKSPLYDDLLYNKYLPNLDEILPALNPDSNQADIIKRLLLDFKDIMIVKGNIQCIDKFFSMIGFVDKQINVYTEYTKPNNTITLSPNTLTDVKNGNYHVIYDNWNIDELTQCNLPYRPFSTENFDLLFESLKYAIPLANKYFTSNEQNIVFFGIKFNSNITRNNNLLGSINQIFVNDVFDFRNMCNIQLYGYNTLSDMETLKINLVKNKQQVSNDVYFAEIKYIKSNQKETENLFFVDGELLDKIDKLNIYDITKYYTDFGAIQHLNIIVVNKYVEIIIDNGIDKITYPKTFIEHILDLSFVVKSLSKHNIQINIYDEYNNRETYIYQSNFSIDKNLIGVDTYTTKNILINNLDLEITSDSETVNNTTNIVLSLSDIPNELSTYYSSIQTQKPRYLNGYTKQLFGIDEYTDIDNLTESIPLEYIGQELESMYIPYSEPIVLYVYDSLTNTNKQISFNQLKQYGGYFDRLYIGKILIGGLEYYYITTTETGIALNEKSFDFRFVSTGESVYKTVEIKKSIPYININLSDKNTTIYSSNITNELKSIYNSMFIDVVPNNYVFGIGDIFVCKLNTNLVTKFKDVKWTIKNSFTKEDVFVSNNYALNFMINEQTIYDVMCEFTIKDEKISIEKNSLITSIELRT